jgi:hypothetical protein
MQDELTPLKNVGEITPAEMEEFLGVEPEGILKVTAEEWKGDWAAGVANNADRWKRRTEGTKKDVVALAIAAEPKYQDKMKQVLANQSRAKALKQTSTAEVLAAVAATPSSAYSEGASRRAPKFGRKIDTQYPLREYAKKDLDAMPQDTDSQREKKMIAAKRTNQAIGLFLKGVIDIGTCRTQIDAACK